MNFLTNPHIKCYRTMLVRKWSASDQLWLDSTHAAASAATDSVDASWNTRATVIGTVFRCMVTLMRMQKSLLARAVLVVVGWAWYAQLAPPSWPFTACSVTSHAACVTFSALNNGDGLQSGYQQLPGQPAERLCSVHQPAVAEWSRLYFILWVVLLYGSVPTYWPTGRTGKVVHCRYQLHASFPTMWQLLAVSLFCYSFVLCLVVWLAIVLTPALVAFALAVLAVQSWNILLQLLLYASAAVACYMLVDEYSWVLSACFALVVDFSLLVFIQARLLWAGKWWVRLSAVVMLSAGMACATDWYQVYLFYAPVHDTTIWACDWALWLVFLLSGGATAVMHSLCVLWRVACFCFAAVMLAAHLSWQLSCLCIRFLVCDWLQLGMAANVVTLLVQSWQACQADNFFPLVNLYLCIIVGFTWVTCVCVAYLCSETLDASVAGVCTETDRAGLKLKQLHLCINIAVLVWRFAAASLALMACILLPSYLVPLMDLWHCLLYVLIVAVPWGALCLLPVCNAIYDLRSSQLQVSKHRCLCECSALRAAYFRIVVHLLFDDVRVGLVSAVAGFCGMCTALLRVPLSFCRHLTQLRLKSRHHGRCAGEFLAVASLLLSLKFDG